MSEHKCHAHGSHLERISKEIVTVVGPYKVRDKSGQLMACPNCDYFVMTADEALGYELRAARTALHDLPEISGDVLRFARRAMDLQQDELAEILGMNRSTISRMETGEYTIARPTQLAMLALVKLAIEGGSPTPLEDLKHPEPVEMGAELQMAG